LRLKAFPPGGVRAAGVAAVGPGRQLAFDRFRERDLAAEYPMGRRTRDRHPPSASLPAEPLGVRNLARGRICRKLVAHRPSHSARDRPGGEGVARATVPSRRRSLLVDELDGSVVVKQRVDHAVSPRRVARADPEQDPPGCEPVS